MFKHIMIGSNDMQASKKFYDATMQALGHKEGRLDKRGLCIYTSGAGALVITSPLNKEAATHGNGNTIAFAAPSPEAADAWHEAGLANGGTACEDPPGEREGSGLYLAYLRDPSGHKICALYE